MCEGEKTKISPYIKKVAESMKGQGLELIENVSKYVSSISAKEWPHWTELPDFRVGSADELLKRKTLYGCIELGTVFRTLCIARGIPAIFVETLNKKWLKSKPDPKNPRMIEGHVFIDVFVESKWHTIDPGSSSWLHKHKDYSIKVNNQ